MSGVPLPGHGLHASARIGTMYAGPWRHARSLTVGAVCVALSLAGHLAGGGRAPDPGHALVAVLAVVVVTALVCLALGWASRRRWTFGRAVLFLGLGQAVLHAAFTLVLLPAGHPGGPASSAMPDMAGMARRSGMAGAGGMGGGGGGASRGSGGGGGAPRPSGPRPRRGPPARPAASAPARTR